MISFFILFISGILWGFLDLLRKLCLEFFSTTQIVYIILLSQLTIFFFSLYFSNLNISNFHYFILLLIISLLNIISLYLFLKAIKNEQISLCIPLLSYSPLFSLLFSKFLLEENLTTIQYIGIFIIFFGSFILFSKTLKARDLLVSPFSLIKNKGAQKIILVTIIWSLVPVLDKKSLLYTDIFMHGFLQSFLGILFLFLFVKTPRFNSFLTYKNRTQVYLFLLLVVVSFLATIIQFEALKVNLVPILEVVKRAIGILLSLFFGYIFFKEQINKKKILSIVVIITGLIFTL